MILILFKTLSFKSLKKIDFLKFYFLKIICCFSVNTENESGKKRNYWTVFLRRLQTGKNDEKFGKLLISKDGSTIV